MKGTEKFQRNGVEWEVICTSQFHNEYTGKYYVAKMVEPVDQVLLEKLGTVLFEKEVIFLEGSEKGHYSEKIEYNVLDLPPAVQGLLSKLRRQAIETMHATNSLDGILDQLIKSKIAEKLPDSIMPDGIAGVMFSPKPKPGEWKLYGIDSEIEFPYGEIVKDTQGNRFELVGGTPPHDSQSTGFIRVIDGFNEKHEYSTHIFKLEWRRVESP